MIASNHKGLDALSAAPAEIAKLQNRRPVLSGLVTRRRGRSSSVEPVWVGALASAAWLLDTRAGASGLTVIGVVPSVLPPKVAEWCHRDLPEGWTVESVWDTKAEAPQVRWRHEDGRSVIMLSAGVWFGQGHYTADEAAYAWRSTVAALRFSWHGYSPQPVMCPTPATTGRVLWQSHISGPGYPVLDDETQAFIRATSGQGRVEYLPDAIETYSASTLTEIDARLAYLDLCRDLPTGEPRVQDHMPTGDDLHRNWRALATWQAPPDYAHLGLLPERRGDGKWHYPYRGRGWIDRSEWYLARKWGWTLTCEQAIVWPGHADPLGGWAERIVEATEWLDDNRPGETVYTMARHALRHIGIDALGAFHGTPRRTTVTVPIERAHEVPEDATDVRYLDDDIAYEAPAPNGWAAVMAHPEWSATVWARCRVRILDGGVHKATGNHEGEGALFLPFSSVVAIQTDAVIARDLGYGEGQGMPGLPWPESGAVGALRRKAVHAGRWELRTSGDVLAALGKGKR